MQSLLLTAAEAKAENSINGLSDAPKYPYGTSICLDKDALDKIGMTSLPAINAEMMLTAKVLVISISQDERLEGKPYSRVELQITEMDLSPEKENRTDLDRANSLYGDAD